MRSLRVVLLVVMAMQIGSCRLGHALLRRVVVAAPLRLTLHCSARSLWSACEGHPKDTMVIACVWQWVWRCSEPPHFVRCGDVHNIGAAFPLALPAVTLNPFACSGKQASSFSGRVAHAGRAYHCGGGTALCCFGYRIIGLPKV